MAILDRPAPTLPASGSYPRGAAAVVTRALTKDRNKRFQSARDMFAELEALRQPSRQLVDWKEIVAPRRRRQWRTLVLLAGASAIAAGAITWWLVRGRTELLAPSWLDFGPPEQVTAAGNVQLIDIDDDGRAEVVVDDAGKTTIWKWDGTRFVPR